MKLVIVDYDAGNVGSVANALSRLGVSNFVVTNDPYEIKSSDGVIFPGQGRAGSAMKSIVDNGLDKLLPTLNQPFIGICLGMQLLLDETEEDNVKALGIIPGKCQKLTVDLPLPQMGWNKLQIKQDSNLFEGLAEDSYVYFANSYAANCRDEYVASAVSYGGEIISSIEKDNFYGIQFHPEKSGPVGEQILSNFVKLCGEK